MEIFCFTPFSYIIRPSNPLKQTPEIERLVCVCPRRTGVTRRDRHIALVRVQERAKYKAYFRSLRVAEPAGGSFLALLTIKKSGRADRNLAALANGKQKFNQK
jgi:hypothetical protein